MTKQPPATDSADKLTNRQGELALKLLEGYNNGGLCEGEWMKIRYATLRKSSQGFLSPQAIQTIKNMTQYKAYRHPRKLLQLLDLMEPDFEKVLRIYTNKGLLTLNTDTTHQPQSTIADPQPLEVATGAAEKEENQK